jgi:tRNA(Ile2) C34 agmatinyltransferase TiaS
MTHAPEPICPHCHEDRPAMIDKGRTMCHCKVCGKSWRIDES